MGTFGKEEALPKGEQYGFTSDGRKVVYEIEVGPSDDLGFQRLYRHVKRVCEDYKAPERIDPRSFDAAKFALECASGGRNTLLFDDLGRPSVMVRIPRFNWSDVVAGGEDKPCSAFVVGGRVLDSVYISKYPNVIEDGRAYSLPGRDPAHTVTIDDAREACARKGRGWHLFTNAEWCALAHWCMKNGTVPRGNSNFGLADKNEHERGVLSPENELSATPSSRTLTGSGPDSWNHDFGPFGVTDLNGNVWDWVAGARVMDGEIQIIPDNDSALNVDEGTDSPCWRAVNTKGELVAPGSPDTYKYDGVTPGVDTQKVVIVPGGVKLSTRLELPQYTGPMTPDADYAYAYTMFKDTLADTPPHILLKELGLFPVDHPASDGLFFIKNYGERPLARGGSWWDKSPGWLWDLYFRELKDFIFPDIGLRASYVEL
ncbi:MAG: SUMF1/EgtB/PvdO family nonheme iron enzyme [Acidobacteriota bacterium]|nr:SUMF1/EgtB/PvdO family nonheme iron enzyme [Acidobacteriota bacterium]